MVEKNHVSVDSQVETGSEPAEKVDESRRAALKNIGVLAGAAPAVAVLLSPSASRAHGNGGSPVEGGFHGRGPGPRYTPWGSGAPGSRPGLLGTRDTNGN